MTRREITTGEAFALAAEQGCEYRELSAKDGAAVERVFLGAAERIFKEVELGMAQQQQQERMVIDGAGRLRQLGSSRAYRLCACLLACVPRVLCRWHRQSGVDSLCVLISATNLQTNTRLLLLRRLPGTKRRQHDPAAPVVPEGSRGPVLLATGPPFCP